MLVYIDDRANEEFENTEDYSYGYDYGEDSQDDIKNNSNEYPVDEYQINDDYFFNA